MSSKITASVNSNGMICGVQKDGSGGIAPSAFAELLSCARTIGLKLLAQCEQSNKQKAQQ